MGPSDQRFNDLREYVTPPPADLTDQVLHEFRKNGTRPDFSEKERDTFSPLSALEIPPPALISEAIHQHFSRSRSSGRFLIKLLSVLAVSSAAMAIFIYHINGKKSESSETIVKHSPLISSNDKLVPDTSRKKDSLVKIKTDTKPALPSKNLTINGLSVPLEDSDILYCYVLYKIAETKEGDPSATDFLSIDEYSTIRISPYISRLIRLSIQQNKQGELKRRAKRILRKLEGIQQEEKARFSDWRISNPLNPLELATFIDAEKKQ
ncbi:MAG: hypothetical protein A1D16_20915 [Flavihumibacter sp. CACIAM 22H1]|nr:MAG: hypothetical protein A1D16_20915 [Flavihumibacter sp. CACIAM 22H1]